MDMEYIAFNPLYTLKPDEGRTLVMARLMGRNMLDGIEDSFTNAIHPIYAMILSFVDGREKSLCISSAAESLNVSAELVEKFVNNLIDNPKQIAMKANSGVSTFPPHTIVSSTQPMHEHRYQPEMFEYDKADVVMKRHATPSVLTLMVNNTCVTDCIYCYQDKSRRAHCTIPLERIIELIREAKQLNVNTFDVIGGEFFLYPHWREVLAELRNNDYNPYLSTKMPVDEAIVRTLAQLNVLDIQISLDTLIDSHLADSLKVKPGYAERMADSLRLLDKYHIPVMIHSVLTRHNGSEDDMKSLYDLFSTLGNIKDWHIVKGDPTLYPRAPYSEIEISAEAMGEAIRYLASIAKTSRFSIRYPEMMPQDVDNQLSEADMPAEADREEKFFDNRTFCSGLFSSLYILPDGKVTICEQLYWNPHFIVGDVMRNSIQEIWNSEKAKSLYFIKQTDIPDDSLCHSCTRFDECRNLRQVCYREIVRKHGSDKWYYPDINCPFTTR